MMLDLDCWRCEKPGHTAAECQRPPAKTRQELDQRITRHIMRWDAGYGPITKAQMHKYIAAEKKSYDDEIAKRKAA